VLASCTSTRGTRVLYTWIVVRRRVALLPTMTCGPVLAGEASARVGVGAGGSSPHERTSDKEASPRWEYGMGLDARGIPCP
jgi:hypothetical protein